MINSTFITYRFQLSTFHSSKKVVFTFLRSGQTLSDIPMTLDAQVPITVKSHMVFVIAAFGRVATRTGHHLAGPRVEHLRADRMGKRTV